MKLLSLFEPEESVGRWWHRLAGEHDSLPDFPDATVRFQDIERGVQIFFRGLGGSHGIEIKASAPDSSKHRLSLRQRLGRESERIARASYNAERFVLPEKIGLFPDPALNRHLYFWLTAWTATAASIPIAPAPDPFTRDIHRLRHAVLAETATLKEFPGLRGRHAALRDALLSIRPRRGLPELEAQVEAAIRVLLGDAAASSPLLGVITSDILVTTRPPGDYRPHLPVALWGEIEPLPEPGPKRRKDPDEAGPGAGSKGQSQTRRAKRNKSDEIDRERSFFLHRFEKILSWSEFMNLHRDVEDDEEENARKAAGDQDELGVADIQKKAATKLKMDLDLSPQDVVAEALSDTHTYPEWDYRSNRYLPHNVRVLARTGEEAPAGQGLDFNAETRRRIRQVKRQFEALRPKRQLLRAQLDGSEYDMDALVRAQIDALATGQPSDRIYLQARAELRDLAVAVLIDVSRSTEAYVGERSVIDIEKEALTALAEGLAACQDDVALFAFSSLRRDRIWVTMLKDFSSPVDSAVRARIAALTPGHYTRLGGAIRHVSACLNKRPNTRRLLLVLSDGKPNDLDHYEGRYGIEDSRKSIQEARAAGQAVFGIAVDKDACAYIPRIFGAGAYAIVNRPERLTQALPALYRQIVR